MQKHHDLPGSTEWHARRAASLQRWRRAGHAGLLTEQDAHQLLDELSSGVSREFSDYVQERVIDPGHVVEARCRFVAEDILGEELQVLGGSVRIEGLSRPLGASLDGITFMEDTNWECKSLNDELRAALAHSGRDSHELNDGKALPKDKRVQMEQQLLASGAQRTLFSAASLDADDEIEEERHAWYYPDLALRAEIVAGWRQFDVDLAAHSPKTRAPGCRRRAGRGLAERRGSGHRRDRDPREF